MVISLEEAQRIQEEHRAKMQEARYAEVNPGDTIPTAEGLRDAAAQAEVYKQNLVDSYISRLQDSANVIIDGKRGNPAEFYRTLIELKTKVSPDIIVEVINKYNLAKDLLDNNTQVDGGEYESAFSKLDHLKIGLAIALDPVAKAKMVRTIISIDYDLLTEVPKTEAGKLLDILIEGKTYGEIRDCYNSQHPGREMDLDLRATFPETAEKIADEVAKYHDVEASREQNTEVMEKLRSLEQKIIRLERENAELREGDDTSTDTSEAYDGGDSYTEEDSRRSRRIPVRTASLRIYSPPEGEED